MSEASRKCGVDALVLGAGIVGTSVAVNLAKRRKSVILIDRHAPGEEASYGNGGLIQRDGVFPLRFPRRLADILKYALNSKPHLHYHASAIPYLASFLFRYWKNSDGERYWSIVDRYSPLIASSLREHDSLANEAGASMLLRKDGWLRLFRTVRERDAHCELAKKAAEEYGVEWNYRTANELLKFEPDLNPKFVGAIEWTGSWRTEDPGALTKAYAKYFTSLGGMLLRADARAIERRRGCWYLKAEEFAVEAKDIFVALGSRSVDLLSRIGLKSPPFAVKRGYHMHYRLQPGSSLNRPILDTEGGYLLAPMAKGVRLTTGVEFALADSPRSPVQLSRAELKAKSVLPLGERVEAEPWMGLRPCTVDMLPIIGRAPDHEHVWYAFGHAHHGLTLGPATGRLIAEMLIGEPPFVEPTPFRADRF